MHTLSIPTFRRQGWCRGAYVVTIRILKKLQKSLSDIMTFTSRYCSSKEGWSPDSASDWCEIPKASTMKDTVDFDHMNGFIISNWSYDWLPENENCFTRVLAPKTGGRFRYWSRHSKLQIRTYEIWSYELPHTRSSWKLISLQTSQHPNPLNKNNPNASFF